jgi:Family of unknown function (DUF5719)
MNRRTREAVFAAGIVVILALGLAYEVIVDPVASVEMANTISVRDKAFSSRASYCPPSLRALRSTTRIAVASPSKARVPIGVEPAGTPTPVASPTEAAGAASPRAGGLQGPPSTRLKNLRPGRAVFQRVPENGAVNVVGYGGPLAASAVFTVSPSGMGGAGCSPVAGRQWYFPEGSSELGYDERLILYNPFPDEAVVRVSFVTPRGTVTKANLSDRAVASGATVTIRLNDFVLKKPLLSTTVDVIRGRVVAWRMLTARATNRPKGLQFSLGATTSHDEWFFPDGAIGRGYDERILLLNPNAQEARVNVSVFTRKGTQQPRKLVNITIPPASSRSVAPAAAMKTPRGRPLAIATEVTSTNGVDVVAERTVWYSRGDLTGVTSEIGATNTAARWYLGPASFAPKSDAVVVLNPATAPATVSITLERERSALAPAPLQRLRIKPGTRRRVLLTKWTAGRPVVAVLTSDQRVVAERFSYSPRAHDVSALMGRSLQVGAP